MLSPGSCHWDVVPAGQRCPWCGMGACVSPGTQEKCGMGWDERAWGKGG